jgi:hypothetical protein
MDMDMRMVVCCMCCYAFDWICEDERNNENETKKKEGKKKTMDDKKSTTSTSTYASLMYTKYINQQKPTISLLTEKRVDRSGKAKSYKDLVVDGIRWG